MRGTLAVLLAAWACAAEAQVGWPTYFPSSGSGSSSTAASSSRNAVLYVPFNTPGCYASGSTALATNGAAMTVSRTGAKLYPDTPNGGWWASCAANSLAVDGVFGGAVLDGAGTNLLGTPTDSPTSSGNWSLIAAGPTVTQNSTDITFLDGTQTTSKFQESAGVVSGIQQSITTVAAPYCLSAVFQYNSRDCIGFSLDGSTVAAKFNIKTAGVTYCPTWPDCTSSSATVQASVHQLGQGFVEAVACQTLGAATANRQIFATAACSDNTQAATGGASVTYIARVQLETRVGANGPVQSTAYTPTGTTRGQEVLSFPVTFADGNVCIGAKVSPRTSPWSSRKLSDAFVISAYGATDTLAAANSMYVQLTSTGAIFSVYDNAAAAKTVTISTVDSAASSARVRDVKACTSSAGVMSLSLDGSIGTTAAGAGTGILTTPPTKLVVGAGGGSGFYAVTTSGAFYDVIACNVSDPTSCGNSLLPAGSLALGDSITSGVQTAGVTQPWSYVASAAVGTPIAQVSRAGWTSTECLTAYTGTRSFRHYKRVAVLCGTNDIGLSAFDRIRRTYEAILADGAIPVPMTILPRNAAGQTETDRLNINKQILRWCADNNVRCADSATFMADGGGNDLQAAYDSGDGLHPNQAGHTALGGYMAQFFR